MKRWFRLLVVMGLLIPMWFVPEEMTSTAQAFQSLASGPPVLLRLDPNPSTHRVPAPAQALSADSIQTANITISYLPAGATNAFGYTCLTWPAAAQTAFRYAADIWETLISSPVTIVIEACWADMPSGILGGGGSETYYRDFTGAPVPSTWYPVSLANAIYGADLDPTDPDINIVYNKDYQDTGEWYFGTDGNPGGGQIDFASVVLHEIAHGLGFSGSMRVSSGLGSWGLDSGYPFGYDRYAEDGSGVSLLNTAVYPNPSAALATALTSNNVWFDAPNARAANAGTRVKLYAPSTWIQGSSYSHLDEIFNGTVNALMTYSIGPGESIHDPGPVGMGILHDVGWTDEAVPPPSITSIVPSTAPNTGTVAVTVAGSDFQTGATLKLTQIGQPDISASSVVVNASQITGNLNLLGVATGAWNVVITNPDTQSDTLPNGFTVTFPGKTWTGAISTDWHTNGNWNPSGVPGSADDVTIPDVTRDPVISSSNAAVKSLTINSGAIVDLTTRMLTVEGALTNKGTLKQTRGVTQGSATEFLRITNLAGTLTKYYGVTLTPTDIAAVSARTGPPQLTLTAVDDRDAVPQQLSPAQPTATDDWVTIVSEGFEGVFPGPWRVLDSNGTDYGEYYWAKRDCLPYSGSYSGWAVGGGANGASLTCGSNYPNDAYSWMIYGPFSLADATAADFSYKLWIYSQYSDGVYYDYVTRAASIDGSQFYGWRTAGNSSGWIDKVLDLTDVPTLGDVTGQPEVWVALIFRSDSSVNYAAGAYVDDVVLRKYTGGCEPVSGADFTWTPTSPLTGQSVSFSGSVAAGLLPITYSWNFGDGGTGTGQTVAHTFATAKTYSVVVTATNSCPSQDTATHNVIVSAPANTAPVIAGLPDQSLQVNGTANNVIDLWAHTTDAESTDAELIYTIDNVPSAGAGVRIDSNRYIDIFPDTDWTGETDVTIRVTDPGGLYGTDTFRVTVSSTPNTAPVITGLPDKSLQMDSSINNAIDLWAYTSDAQSADDLLTYSIDNVPAAGAGVSIDANRYIDIYPQPGWVGQTDVIVRVTDPGGLFDTDTFRVTVTSTPNTAPVITGLPDKSLQMDGSINNAIDLWAYTSDAESADDLLTYSLDNVPAAGAGVSIDANRYIDIYPQAGWTGQTDVVVRVADPGGLYDTDTFVVTVTGVAPTNVTVAISGNQFCAGRTTGVKRCFSVAPAASMTATVRFYFTEAERNSLLLNDLLVFHYDGVWTQEPGPFTRGGSGDAQYVQAANVDGFSLFALDKQRSLATYLPMVPKRWPPIPATPVLNPISNADGDGNYVVTWNPADLAQSYTLQEASEPTFASPITRYTGSGTSWTASNKTTGTYYYRVRASRLVDSTTYYSAWSAVQSVKVLLPSKLYATEDAVVIQNLAGTNFGSTVDMWVGYGEGACIDSSSDLGITRSLAKFSLSSVPAGASISSAKLYLRLGGWCRGTNTSPRTVTVYRNLSGWSESSVTWNTKPSYAEAVGSAAVGYTVDAWYSFDITGVVRSWASGSLPNYGVTIRGPEGSGSDFAWFGFYTSESSYDPYLVITFAASALSEQESITVPLVNDVGVEALPGVYLNAPCREGFGALGPSVCGLSR